MNITLQIIMDINILKARLIKKAKKSGLYQNFGMKEVRGLRDKYVANRFDNDQKVWKMIIKFSEWCQNFDPSDLRGYNMESNKMKETKVYKFDELEDDIRDVIIQDIIEYDTKIDHLSFKIARSQSYDEDGEVVKKPKAGLTFEQIKKLHEVSRVKI